MNKATRIPELFHEHHPRSSPLSPTLPRKGGGSPSARASLTCWDSPACPQRAEAGRLRDFPDWRSVLSALGDHRCSARARPAFPAIRTVSHGRAHLHRRIHGALMGGQRAQRETRHARRVASCPRSLRCRETENRLLQCGRPRRRFCAAGMDQTAPAVSYFMQDIEPQRRAKRAERHRKIIWTSPAPSSASLRLCWPALR